MGKKTKASLRITAEPKDVDENIVYVYNSKQSTNVPSLSPWCVALETYVRFIKGEYKKASTEKRIEKMHGDPKIILNQQEHVGFEKCLETLSKHFQKDDEFLADASLSDDEKADAEAFVRADVETVLFNCLTVMRSKKGQDGMHAILKTIRNQTQQLLKPKETDDRSMSKLTTDEVVKRTKDALNAVANYLHRGSTKSFMFGGEKPTKYDAIVFGVLVQFYFESSNEFNLKEYLDQDLPNLVAYMNHIKNTYWSDWETCCAPPPPPVAAVAKKEVVEKDKDKAEPAAVDVNEVHINGTEVAAAMPNGASEKIAEKEDEEKLAPKAIEESPKAAATPEDKKVPTPLAEVTKVPTPSGGDAKGDNEVIIPAAAIEVAKNE